MWHLLTYSFKVSASFLLSRGRPAPAPVQEAQPVDGAGAAHLQLGREPVWSGASDGVGVCVCAWALAS